MADKIPKDNGKDDEEMTTSGAFNAAGEPGLC